MLVDAKNTPAQCCRFNLIYGLTHPVRWMLKRAIGGILAKAVLPESTDSTRCQRRLAVSKKTVVTLRKRHTHRKTLRISTRKELQEREYRCGLPHEDETCSENAHSIVSLHSRHVCYLSENHAGVCETILR